jgi:predicted DNA-binding transcriptional regulator AlpA
MKGGQRRTTARRRAHRRGVRQRVRPQAIAAATAEAAPATPPSLLLTVNEILRELRISRTQFWRLRQQSGFPAAIMLGSFSIRFRRADLETWLARQQAAPGAAA